MTQVVLLRDKTSHEGTSGWLFIDGKEFCRTLELPWHNNDSGISCIPTGEYPTSIYDSPKRGKVYLLGKTSPRTFIEIHSGNWAGAERLGYASDVDGCILLGTHFSQASQLMIHNSLETVEKFMDKMKGLPFLLQIGGVSGWETAK